MICSSGLCIPAHQKGGSVFCICAKFTADASSNKRLNSFFISCCLFSFKPSLFQRGNIRIIFVSSSPRPSPKERAGVRTIKNLQGLKDLTGYIYLYCYQFIWLYSYGFSVYING